MFRDSIYHRPSIPSRSARLPREVLLDLPALSKLITKPADYREKDGYTMETLDIHNIGSDGLEKVIIHDVGVVFYSTVGDCAESL